MNPTPNPMPACLLWAQSRRGWLRAALYGAGAAVNAVAWAQAGRDAVLVLFPEIAEPYRSVFAAIMDAIDERLPQRAQRMPLPTHADASEALVELQRRRPLVVIALGRAGLRTAVTVPGSTPIVGGCVISPTAADARVATLYSLAPDPALLLQRLKQLQPGVRRVHVVYAPIHNGWLIRLAGQAARTHGLELKPRGADDLRGAVQRYQEVLADATAQDAVWLPQDAITVEESTVLPLVLHEAWARSVPVFSSNLAHVRRGALFALYPNNVALGHSLGHAALAHLQSANSPARGVLPLRDVFAGLNIRTASHLGIEYSANLHGKFDTLLPER